MSGDEAAADVFSLLADETRVDVLRAVARAQAEREGADAGPGQLRFSEIYDRVDVDGTSKLSYHLEKLTGTFLRKDGDTYAFTHAGETMVRFVLSGNYGSPPAAEATPVEGTCFHCESSDLEAIIDEQFFFVRCPACERPVTAYHVAPAQARGVSGAELVERVVERQTAELELVRRGTCPDCFGPLSTSVRSVPEGAVAEPISFLFVGECEACLRRISNPLPFLVAYHPASVAFHWNAGVDVTTRGVWELAAELVAGRWTADRSADNPAAYEVVYRRDDEVLRFHLDANATVTGTEQVRRTGSNGE